MANDSTLSTGIQQPPLINPPAVDPPASWFAWGAAALENFVFPVFYFYLSWHLLTDKSEMDIFNRSGYWSAPLRQIFDFNDPVSVSGLLQLAQSTLLFIVQFSIGVTLVINRRPVARYQTFLEVFVPTLMAFFYITYDYTDKVPLWWQASLIDNFDPRRPTLAMAGLILGVVGTAISVWGILSLGRSFGILVAVRKVVVRGPYRFVRHPIYLGYMLGFIGLFLITPSPINFVLVTCSYAITAWRAKLEESKLSRVSPEYREHRNRTGFIFPKLPWDYIR